MRLENSCGFIATDNNSERQYFSFHSRVTSKAHSRQWTQMRQINKLKCWKQRNNFGCVSQTSSEIGIWSSAMLHCGNLKKVKKRDFKTGCARTPLHELSRIIPNFSVSESNYQKTNHTSGLCHYRFMCCDLYVKLTWACCLSTHMFARFTVCPNNFLFLRKMKSTINSLDKSFLWQTL